MLKTNLDPVCLWHGASDLDKKNTYMSLHKQQVKPTNKSSYNH